MLSSQTQCVSDIHNVGRTHTQCVSDKTHIFCLHIKFALYHIHISQCARSAQPAMTIPVRQDWVLMRMTHTQCVLDTTHIFCSQNKYARYQSLFIQKSSQTAQIWWRQRAIMWMMPISPVPCQAGWQCQPSYSAVSLCKIRMERKRCYEEENNTTDTWCIVVDYLLSIAKDAAVHHGTVRSRFMQVWDSFIPVYLGTWEYIPRSPVLFQLLHHPAGQVLDRLKVESCQITAAELERHTSSIPNHFIAFFRLAHAVA